MLTPKAPTWIFLIDVVSNLERNAMYDIEIE
jgi:hypothetical protein